MKKSTKNLAVITLLTSFMAYCSPPVKTEKPTIRPPMTGAILEKDTSMIINLSMPKGWKAEIIPSDSLEYFNRIIDSANSKP